MKLAAGMGLLLSVPTSVAARSCFHGGTTGSPERTDWLLKRYPVIFVGRVVTVEERATPTPTPPRTPRPRPGETVAGSDLPRPPDVTRVTLEVDRVIQGTSRGDRVVVRNTDLRSTCSNRLHAEREYLLFAANDGEGLAVGGCNPSQGSESAGVLIESLAQEAQRRDAAPRQK
jgi:hypothetical protein